MATVVTNAVAWAVGIANDDSHGYDQNSRWGPDYDCSSLIIQAYENAGVPVKTSGASYTGNMVAHFKKCGFKDVTDSVNLKTGEGLIAGDVVWKKGHVEMMCSSTQLVGAHSNENGEITGGTKGDQTGREINVRDYYNSPWTTVLRYPSGEFTGVTHADVVFGNRYLSLEEMQINAKYIYSYLYAYGWTLNAIAGMLGNMQRESTINPAIWQNLDEGNMELGFGLVQWTPASKYIEWCDSNFISPYSDIDSNLKRILWEVENNEQYIETSDYPLSFTEFTHSTKSPEWLASAFLHNYERAGVSAEAERQENARYWYDFLKTYDPSTPIEEKKRVGLSLLMMYMATKGI